MIKSLIRFKKKNPKIQHYQEIASLPEKYKMVMEVS